MTNVFESFHSKCIETYRLYPTCVLGQQVCLKKVEVELELFTNVSYHAWKVMIQIKNLHLMCYDANNLSGQALSQKLHVDDFGEKSCLRLRKNSYKTMLKTYIPKDTYLKLIFIILTNCRKSAVISHFFPKQCRLTSVITRV